MNIFPQNPLKFLYQFLNLFHREIILSVLQPPKMAPNLFSLTNLLLATSFLFALTHGAPIPKALDPDRDSAFLPTRDMWSEVAAVRPRYSAIDNLRFSSPAENPRVVPISPKWVEATFDPKEPVQLEKLSKRAPFAPHFRIGTVMHP